MKETIHKLNQLLKSGRDYLSKTSESELATKASPEKWSKKEILGHLIDSGINNLQRFTEIQFENKPYKIRKYNQNELVKVNDYQNSDIKEILEFWCSINSRIKKVMELQTNDSLNYKIELEKNNISDLRFLMTDYVNHLEHHLNQIMDKNS
ncbi:DinB family protein [Tenacibaculum singaporense]|uniref:DinB family protein n=1 Tax=Tenacibaculum singaporense TaxID=2358479 RepID=A0A3S8R7E3_9FLAO|nr:DinB family protein [Tenacibaculum singaporense]AZJ35676.1 DinB family protein [Tenacibaculum singaporense]RSC92931.1 DinB family protein [Tenacibaculum singaporense]